MQSKENWNIIQHKTYIMQMDIPYKHIYKHIYIHIYTGVIYINDDDDVVKTLNKWSLGMLYYMGHLFRFTSYTDTINEI